MAHNARELIDSDCHEEELLLVSPVCLGQNSDGLLFESQACDGMESWLENFSRILVLCPMLSGENLRQAHSVVWKPVTQIRGADRVKFVPLPYAYSLASFSRKYVQGRTAIRSAIARSRYLCFAIGGLFGDWGAVACLEAKRLHRPYAVWTDRVEHQVGLLSCSQSNPLRRLKARVKSRLMYSLERRCIRNSTLGLFHGASCHAQYAPWCETSYLVHDFPTKETVVITNQQLEDKCNQVAQSTALKIGYLGRADEMKGPFDWLEVMELLHKRGVPFKAVWLGEGPMLADMRDHVDRRRLGDVISLPGFLSSRAEVLAFLRDTDLLVFCHKTPESPRCLVEALVSGCPIVGYDSEYAAELIRGGGGVLVRVGEKEQLVDQVCALNDNRSELSALTRAAVSSGKRINEVAGFQYRSNLIKAHL